MVLFFAPMPMLIMATRRRKRAFSGTEGDLSAAALGFLYLVVFLFYMSCWFYLRGSMGA